MLSAGPAVVAIDGLDPVGTKALDSWSLHDQLRGQAGLILFYRDRHRLAVDLGDDVAATGSHGYLESFHLDNYRSVATSATSVAVAGWPM